MSNVYHRGSLGAAVARRLAIAGLPRALIVPGAAICVVSLAALSCLPMSESAEDAMKSLLSTTNDWKA